MASLKVVAASDGTLLSRQIEDYLAECRAKGLSRNTIEQSYGYPLRSILLPFCGREGISEVAGLSNRALNQLSSELQERGGARGRPLSRHSIHAYMRAINHFLAWAGREGESVAAKAQLPKLPKRLVEVLSREEVQAMEDAAPSERDKLIVRLLADAGLRVGEVVGLKRNHLLEQNRAFFVKVEAGKGAKDRLVPIAPRLYRRLRAYAEKGRPRDVRSERVFLGLRRGFSGSYEPLSSSGVEQMIRALAVKAGIERRVYPHLLRHSWFTWMLSRNVNPVLLAQMGGHSSLSMIQNVYAHLTPQDAYTALLAAISSDE